MLAGSARIPLAAGEAGELAAVEDRHLAREVAVGALRVVAVPLGRVVVRLGHFADVHVVNPGLEFAR
jgi:hypothetical protein